MPGFGRLPARDIRDRDYSLRTLVEAPPTVVTRILPWRAPRPLDQGNTSRCVGFSCMHFLASAPYMHVPTEALADELYNRAQDLDEWPGTDYDGSSVRAGMKALQAMGLIQGGYRWATAADIVRKYTSLYGPVVLGTDWYDKMMRPDADGYLTPEGGIVGGHAYLCLGYSLSRAAFRILNSWGEEWGDIGRAWLRFEDLNLLLSAYGGEAVSAVEVVPAGRKVGS